MSDDKPSKDEAPSGEPDGQATGDAALEAAFFDEDKMAAIKAELEAEDEAGAGGFGADAADLDDEVEGEDELARILAPKKAVRHPIVATVVILASLVGMYWFWEDLQFFLRSNEPEKLGPASKAVKAGKLKHNTYVTLEGLPITQTMANSKQRSLFGGARSDKVYWFVLKDTDLRVVIMARKPLIIDKHKPGPQITYRPGIFTGRLRRIKNSKRGHDIRSFYKRRSRASREMRRQHEFAGAELLKHVGKSHARLTDLRGKTLDVRRDTLMEIKAAFPGEYELRIHTNMQVPVQKIAVQGGKGAPRCGALDRKQKNRRAKGFGGSVYLRHDPKVVDFKELLKDTEIIAAEGTAGPDDKRPPADGVDRIIGIPPGTVVFNAQKRDCKKACKWAGASCKNSCSEKKGVEISKNVRGLIPVASGGACGGHNGERHVINLKSMPYKNAKRATAYVASLGLPYKLVEDASKTGRKTVGFVVRMPPKKFAELQKLEKRDAPYSFFNIDVREEFFFVQWRNLKRQGSDLIITRTRKGFPATYEVTKGKDGRQVLTPQPLGSTLSIAAERVIRADTSALLVLPDNGYILEEGVKPSSMWSEPFLPGVPIFYLLLVAFILLNLLAIRAYFRG